jgi:hypothetical protein
MSFYSNKEAKKPRTHWVAKCQDARISPSANEIKIEIFLESKYNLKTELHEVKAFV